MRFTQIVRLIAPCLLTGQWVANVATERSPSPCPGWRDVVGADWDGCALVDSRSNMSVVESMVAAQSADERSKDKPGMRRLFPVFAVPQFYFL